MRQVHSIAENEAQLLKLTNSVTGKLAFGVVLAKAIGWMVSGWMVSG